MLKPVFCFLVYLHIQFKAMDTVLQAPVSFTQGAVIELKRLLNEPTMEPGKRLRIGVKGGGCSGMSYVLGFDEQQEADGEFEFDGLPFIMNQSHEIYLYGMQINWEDGLNSRGFTFNNPNASSTCGCGSSFGV
jgi:iron-sulfur cluster assembly accessory protein